MEASGGQRIEWHDVGPDVRRAIESRLGAAVVDARNQPGGFSPGLAARCTLRDGRRAFVKAVSPDQNPHACRIHRREAEVAAQLPSDLPVPRLLHVVDDGHWVALVFEEVEGVQPAEPWTHDQLAVVLPALQRFAERTTPTPAPGLQTVEARYGAAFRGWRQLAAGEADASSYGPDVVAAVDRLAILEEPWAVAASGDTLLHTDLRADNLLITPTGEVVLVDWPWACTGAAFVDLAMLLPSVGLGGPDPASVIEAHHLFADVDPDALVAVLAALAGFFVRQSLDPAPAGLPAIRSFQRAQAQVALGWLLPRIT
ncbi:aminoglycoside phosphotransferase family protein [Acidimicrobiia bacterium EGI L10123]|uniref:aminoglycoside phosphotransferase family protein n=1 Tax=Salinilacustrithrix flava TaxID=2957203 RepID=UPI003D7C288E|nr:aminoglycoside phosphotransferase family protein [Acidimicrobiia bacterium EGI L10123]